MMKKINKIILIGSITFILVILSLSSLFNPLDTEDAHPMVVGIRIHMALIDFKKKCGMFPNQKVGLEALFDGDDQPLCFKKSVYHIPNDFKYVEEYKKIFDQLIYLVSEDQSTVRIMKRNKYFSDEVFIEL